MKKTIKQFVTILILSSLALILHSQIIYAVATPIQQLNDIGKKTNLPSFETGQHADAPADYLAPGIGNITSPIYFAMDLFKLVIGTMAFIYVIISAIKLMSTDKEDEATKVKDHLVYGVIGLIGIQLIDFIVKKVFFGEQGEAFENAANAQMFAEEGTTLLRGLIGFANIFLGIVAVLVIIIRGFAVLTSAGDEEAIGTAKKHILWAVGGLIVIGLSEIIVRGFLFPENGQSLPRIEVGKKLILDITNFVSGFFALVCFVILFYSGYRYVVSGGQEEVNEKVKKAVTGALIGLLLALGAYAAVNTLIKLPETQLPTEDKENTQTQTEILDQNN